MVHRSFFPERLVWWGLLQLALGLSPLIFAAFADGKSGWTAAINRGDLVLVSVVLVGSDVAAASQLHATSDWRRTWRATIVASGVVYCIVAAWFYGHGLDGSAGFRSFIFLCLAMAIGVSDLYLEHVESRRSER